MDYREGIDFTPCSTGNRGGFCPCTVAPGWKGAAGKVAAKGDNLSGSLLPAAASLDMGQYVHHPGEESRAQVCLGRRLHPVEEDAIGSWMDVYLDAGRQVDGEAVNSCDPKSRPAAAMDLHGGHHHHALRTHEEHPPGLNGATLDEVPIPLHAPPPAQSRESRMVRLQIGEHLLPSLDRGLEDTAPGEGAVQPCQGDILGAFPCPSNRLAEPPVYPRRRLVWLFGHSLLLSSVLFHIIT